MSGTITMTGEEYDALHAEAEALRAENEKWQRRAESARGMIRYPCKMWDGEEAESQEYAKGYNMALEHVEKLNATPAPEVQAGGPYASVADALAQRYPKPSLLKDCNVSYSNSSRPLVEQGERQEAVAVKSHGAWDGLDDLDNLPDGTMLYTTPQPGPGVRALVEAVKGVKLTPSDMRHWGRGSVWWNNAVEACLDAIKDAHRQAQP